MRYLNKIIFIESANIKYSEVNVDGNVHFIGTQGVGKSTLLRALLFFYNANQQKLGIPLGKKSFVDFYLPYQNSYIIYEVIRETGAFCILAFKSQGRVCFRFLDTEYKRDYFIDDDGRIRESWDKIKLALGSDVRYSNRIDRYEEYRNILYGNNQSLKAEFRKYAILESKQYQNIPRAIQHVFLNYKVESEFIKDTIIKSLNEEENPIDLSNYAHHLKDFDTQLSDIRKWTEKNKNGEILVRKQADKVITILLKINFNEKEKTHLAHELLWQTHNTSLQLPKIANLIQNEKIKQNQCSDKIGSLEKRFSSAKERIMDSISVFNSKLKDAKLKSAEYTEIDINGIIKRVSKKDDLVREQSTLIEQKILLEEDFSDIDQKFKAQIEQLKNQLFAFKNQKETEINTHNKLSFQQQVSITEEYEKLFNEIRKYHQDELILADSLVDKKREELNRLSIQKVKAKHQRFHEEEIEQQRTMINSLTNKIGTTSQEITQHQQSIVNTRKLWEIDQERAEQASINKKEKLNETINQRLLEIASIDEKLENNKDSLYAWLNANYPDWEKSIGKVIDEKTILFNSSLSPELISSTEKNFYGIKLELSEIDKTAKTVDDYQKDKKHLNKEIKHLKEVHETLSEQLTTDLENLKRKYQPKINQNKDEIGQKEYLIEQSKQKLNEAKVSLDEWQRKAISDQNDTLDSLQKRIENASIEQKIEENKATEIQNGINSRIEKKNKEKNKKIAFAKQETSKSIDEITLEINRKEEETQLLIDKIKTNQQKELIEKGADTERIGVLDLRIEQCKQELDFIEQNRDRVIEYNKDKRELFDQVDSFKNQKSILETKLDTDQTRYKSQKQQLLIQFDKLKEEVKLLQGQLNALQEDLEEFESFKLTDCYLIMVQEFSGSPSPLYKTAKRSKLLIAELIEKYYAGIKRYTELQEAIHKFNGNFSSQNIFKFKTNLIEREEYVQFSEDLKEFIEEDKISLYEKRVNELFADIIKQVGKETSDLLSKEGEIQGVISAINKDFVRRNFAGVIKSIELRVIPSENKIVHLLTEIKKFNDENINALGQENLFSLNDQNRDSKNKTSVNLLTILVKEISNYKHKHINLTDSFELEFKIVENDNDTNWVQNLANVGSDGTDILVKAMINIMLLNVFKEGATKNRFKDFRLHCMMDEIGKLHPENVRGILKFANDRNINLINSSPQSFDALAYRYTYKLAKDKNSVTLINRLITNNREPRPA